MDVSVIIVNYNVRFFLEQCLHSLKRAGDGLAVQTIVVDNASSDGSINYLKPKFTDVHFITNKTNIGFAAACNRGLKEAVGRYVLFLNPDTLLSEDVLHRCIHFFSRHKEAGAVGIKMIDGSGAFLKESKRSFPSPLTSLYKLAGLAKLFPRSKTFSRYHLVHLDADQNHEVDVLAGAFMMIKKEVLDKVGSFDEAFFMYGEDVDLSYRIQKGGYKNYYVPEAQIIHFKGESTRRGSLNYVRMFYQAMSLFVTKHYGGTEAGIFNRAIQTAIRLRAFITIMARFIKCSRLPVLDAGIILFSFWAIKEVWVAYVKTGTIYPDKLLLILFPAYTIVYLTVAYYAGLYNKGYRKWNLVRSTVIATLVLLALYALLPEGLRFSRGIVLFGALLALGLISIFRFVLVRTGLLKEVSYKSAHPYIVVAASASEFSAMNAFFEKNNLTSIIIGRLAIDDKDISGTIAPLTSINEVAAAIGAQEVIFCAGTLSYKQIISFTATLDGSLRLRFRAVGSCSIVGSDSSTASGETLSAETHFNLSVPHNLRLKRGLDVVIALVLILSFPLHLFLVKHPFTLFRNCFRVLFGQKTWIGYISTNKKLPPLRPRVLPVNGIPKGVTQTLAVENLQAIDYWYARDYEPAQDVNIILKHYKHLGS